MQEITTQFYNKISVRGELDYRDLVDLVEVYAPEETDFVASNALYRWSTERITWGGYDYERVLLDRSTVQRLYGESLNEVTFTLSNVRRTIGALFYTTALEGYILVHRIVSRELNDGASYVVPFIGRCQKAVSAGKVRGSLRARQFLGEVNTQLPPRTAGPRCPIKFKGEECLGGEALGSKSATYQLATVCAKDYDTCKSYGNEKKFQGFRFISASGTFKFKANRGGAGGALLSLLGLGRKKVTKQWTTQDDGIWGKPIPLVLGRAQLEGIPMAHADTGTFIAWVVAWCEGPVNKVLNVRAVTPGYDYDQDVYSYLGDYGGIGTQTPGAPGAYFSGTPIDYNSRLVFSTGVSHTNSPDTGDPAPNVSGVILGARLTTPALDGSYTSEGYSDNPVDEALKLITDPKLLAHPRALFDYFEAYQTWLECNEPLVDTSKSEQVLFESGSGAGTSWKIYRSSSVFDVHWLRYLLGLTTDHPSSREISYGTYTTGAPPSATAAQTILRKRYTCNVAVSATEKALDFLQKSIFPTARLYLITGADGKLKLRREKPSASTLLRDAVAVGATALPIEDVLAWKRYHEPLVLIGNGLVTSEVRRVTGWRHSLAGNSMTASAANTGATTCTASAATFSGATDTTPAKVTFTIAGTAAAGATISATIEGVTVSYTLTADDTLATAAGMLAAHINANATLKRFCKAVWAGYPDMSIVKWEQDRNMAIAGSSITAQLSTDPTVSTNPNGQYCSYAQSFDTITEDGQSFAFQVQNQGEAMASSLSALCIVGLTDNAAPVATVVIDGAQQYETYEEPEYQFYFALGTGNVPVVYARTLSGGLLTGELSYTTSSTFRIVRVSSTVIKWYVDGVEVASLTTTVPASLRLAMVGGTRVASAYLQPRCLNARFFDAASSNQAVIKVVSKIGWLDLETPTSFAHSAATEECLYVAMLFSDRAQDVNARANIVKDSLEFPASGRQSAVNQVKVTYTDPLLDYAQVTTLSNDYEHQEQTRSISSVEINATGIDSYNQATRLSNNMLAKLRECDQFIELTTGPQALPLEEGDVVAISTDLAGGASGAAAPGTATTTATETRTYYNYGIAAPIAVIDGAPQSPYPQVGVVGDGDVGRVSVSDGAGGFYVGGSFQTVDGVAQYGIAHLIRSGGEWVRDSAFTIETDGDVYALQLVGSTLYVAGYFSTIGGIARNSLAAIDVSTNSVTSWNPSVTNNGINAMVVSGSNCYITGNFLNVGASSRNYLACVNTSTGAVTSWNPGLDAPGECLLLNGSTLYVGGSFTVAAGASQPYLAAINTSTGANVGAFAPVIDSGVFALAMYGSVLFIGGRFETVNTVSRSFLAAISATTGASGSLGSAAIQYTANGYVESLLVVGDTLYVGGSFTEIGGSGLLVYSGARSRLASFDLTTGIINEWAPLVFGTYDAGALYASSFVHDISLGSDSATFFITGNFTFVGDEEAHTQTTETTTTVATSQSQQLYNYAARVEEVNIEKAPFKVHIVARKYKTSSYSDDVETKTVPLIGGGGIA